eukprot:31270-Pelagococcus_subviridis.AAC.21
MNAFVVGNAGNPPPPDPPPVSSSPSPSAPLCAWTVYTGSTAWICTHAAPAGASPPAGRGVTGVPSGNPAVRLFCSRRVMSPSVRSRGSRCTHVRPRSSMPHASPTSLTR